MGVRRIFCLVVLAAACALGQGQAFSFAVLSDIQSGTDTWQNALAEIRDRKVNPEPVFPPAELVLVVGDLRHGIKDMGPEAGEGHVFEGATPRPVFLPVVGNHEFDKEGEHFRYMRDVLLPALRGAVRRHETSCDYYYDHRNVRIIAVDGYTDLGKGGVINDKGREWVERVITETPPVIEHVFVAFHEPAFPRKRHVGDSFDQDRKRRDAFWRMLLAHRGRVRAVFVGHTHLYSRMRVLDPSGEAANDPKAFPDEAGGLWQINAAQAGIDGVSTIVQVRVAGEGVLFRALQAEKGAGKLFALADAWTWCAE